ncbi:MAG TPA: ribose-phosphate pyrophosphokinase, partial [Alicyclobacillus sp.]|nr:ribose-phosphate pyrophosphokinase [Alicyclobacillus sp.]
GAKALLERGAKEVYACCTHAVLSGPAMERLRESEIREVVVTNTIPLKESPALDKLVVLSVAPLIGDAIIRVHEDLSVSTLFNT